MSKKWSIKWIVEWVKLRRKEHAGVLRQFRNRFIRTALRSHACDRTRDHRIFCEYDKHDFRFYGAVDLVPHWQRQWDDPSLRLAHVRSVESWLSQPYFPNGLTQEPQ
jgi:hypothetical protein